MPIVIILRCLTKYKCGQLQEVKCSETLPYLLLFILGVTISVLNMAADLALVTVLVQLLVDLVASDNIDFYNLMPAVEGECVCSQVWDEYVVVRN